MDKSIITKELQILLEAINEQFEIIREYEDFIPQIEFDMIMENVRKLYEAFHRLQRLNDPLRFVERKKTVLPEASEQVQDEEFTKPEPTTAAQQPQPETAAQQPQPETAMRSIARPTTAAQQPGPKTAAQQPQLFPPEEPVFNVRLKEAREKSLGPKVSRHESLKASIGINDKFMFINELFDGNLRDYNEFIEKLGTFTTLPQSFEFLEATGRKNDWNLASAALIRMKEIVEKRF